MYYNATLSSPYDHLPNLEATTVEMSDPKNPNIAIRSTPQWALMQREMFWAPNDGVFQPFDTGQFTTRCLGDQAD